MRKSLCGAKIWCDWALEGPLKDRLYEYIGTGHVKGEVVYEFHPYKRKGYPVILSYERISLMVTYFKPFLIDSVEFLGGPGAA
jgi:hypothetical protein